MLSKGKRDMKQDNKNNFNNKLFVVYSFAIAFITAGMLLLGALNDNIASNNKQGLQQKEMETSFTGYLQPDKDLMPEQVINAQLEALRKNDVPYRGAGVSANYQFLSPESRKVVGGVERYKALFDDSLYSPLLNYKSARLGEIKLANDSAKQIVFITSRDNRIVGYEFLLSRQKKGQFAGCWMTDRIIRLDDSMA